MTGFNWWPDDLSLGHPLDHKLSLKKRDRVGGCLLSHFFFLSFSFFFSSSQALMCACKSRQLYRSTLSSAIVIVTNDTTATSCNWCCRSCTYSEYALTTETAKSATQQKREKKKKSCDRSSKHFADKISITMCCRKNGAIKAASYNYKITCKFIQCNSHVLMQW